MTAPAPTAAFSAYSTAVRPEWLDYNGHLHDASYGVILSDANEELFAALDLSESYRERAGAAMYTVEQHIRYLAECGPGDVLSATTLLVFADARRMRLYTELRLAGGRLAATGDGVYVHVDGSSGSITPMPDDRLADVRAMVDAHATLPRSEHLGLGVGARLPTPGAAV